MATGSQSTSNKVTLPTASGPKDICSAQSVITSADIRGLEVRSRTIVRIVGLKWMEEINMTGVEILTMEEVAVTFGFSWPIFWFIFVCMAFLATIIIGVSCIPELGLWSFAVGAIAGCIFGAIIGVATANNQLPLEYETQYKVTISDEVSMNDFFERYEILDQEGKIYTVRERNDGK